MIINRKPCVRGTFATAETVEAMPAQRTRCSTDDDSSSPTEAAVDARTVSKRDIEATFRQLGYSNRRSKAGAAAAWKSLNGEDEPEPEEQDQVADFFAALRGLVPR